MAHAKGGRNIPAPFPLNRLALALPDVARVVVDDGRAAGSGDVARIVVDDGRARARPAVLCLDTARRRGEHPRVISAISATITGTAATVSSPPSRPPPPRRGIAVPTPPRAAPCACIAVPPSVASEGYRASASRIAGARYKNVTSCVTRGCFWRFPFFSAS